MDGKLIIKDLHVNIGEKEILKGINLEINKGEIVALMGQNGAGKSTIGMVLMGHPGYTITKGEIIYNGENILEMPTDERAKKGLFLSFQHPPEIPGLSVSNFLRSAYNSVNNTKINVMDFYKILKEKMLMLKIDDQFALRPLNEGFSGGEKKRIEILQLAILEPKMAILDEPDSGTDIDALKTIANGINVIKGNNNMGCLLVTHYNRILQHTNVDKVYVMLNGKIVKEGGKGLADEVEAEGYGKYIN